MEKIDSSENQNLLDIAIKSIERCINIYEKAKIMEECIEEKMGDAITENDMYLSKNAVGLAKFNKYFNAIVSSVGMKEKRKVLMIKITSNSMYPQERFYRIGSKSIRLKPEYRRTSRKIKNWKEYVEFSNNFDEIKKVMSEENITVLEKMVKLIKKVEKDKIKFEEQKTMGKKITTNKEYLVTERHSNDRIPKKIKITTITITGDGNVVFVDETGNEKGSIYLYRRNDEIIDIVNICNFEEEILKLIERMGHKIQNMKSHPFTELDKLVEDKFHEIVTAVNI